MSALLSTYFCLSVSFQQLFKRWKIKEEENTAKKKAQEIKGGQRRAGAGRTYGEYRDDKGLGAGAGEGNLGPDSLLFHLKRARAFLTPPHPHAVVSDPVFSFF